MCIRDRYQGGGVQPSLLPGGTGHAPQGRAVRAVRHERHFHVAGAWAVSYTHLINLRLTVPLIVEHTSERGAVSYTHLDVYKRQQLVLEVRVLFLRGEVTVELHHLDTCLLYTSPPPRAAASNPPGGICPRHNSHRLKSSTIAPTRRHACG